MGWEVLYLRPRYEKKMALLCDIMGVEYYLPLRAETKVYQRRRVSVEKPVFPGYFFVSLNSIERPRLKRTDSVVRTLVPEDESKLLHELQQIKLAMRVDCTLGAAKALKKGRRVRIKTGPFMGVEGVVWQRRSTKTVRLNVDLIGQAVVVDVDGELLEVIG